MYDPKHWKHGNNITAGQFCDYLKENIPDNAVVYICGDSQIFLHLSKDRTFLSIDHDSLSDLPEYDGCEPLEIDLMKEGET